MQHHYHHHFHHHLVYTINLSNNNKICIRTFHQHHNRHEHDPTTKHENSLSNAFARTLFHLTFSHSFSNQEKEFHWRKQKRKKIGRKSNKNPKNKKKYKNHHKKFSTYKKTELNWKRHSWCQLIRFSFERSLKQFFFEYFLTKNFTK